MLVNITREAWKLVEANSMNGLAAPVENDDGTVEVWLEDDVLEYLEHFHTDVSTAIMRALTKGNA